ncbi:MAG: MarC family protein [Candidatus Omnitrophica bacterium]|nr:MarC family protein [Candidatus Omnitrophota bacterium]MDD5356468.1 MarC family protein [Candidatus Omnitrophota bacterium]
MNNFLLALIPVFVAVDAIGVLPIFVSLTEGLKRKDKRKIIFNSMVTAICFAVAFVFLGKAVLKILGITVGDFMIAGGFVLFCIAIKDILNPGKQRRIPTKELGAVPLGIPLIVGPAVLTTTLIIIAEYGIAATLVSVVVNVVLAGLIFSSSGILIKLLGENGTRALSKITSLLLAAIAVMMIRKGVVNIITPALY